MSVRISGVEFDLKKFYLISFQVRKITGICEFEFKIAKIIDLCGRARMGRIEFGKGKQKWCIL